MESSARNDTANKNKMRNAQMRLLFLILAGLVAVITIVMHMHIGSSSRMILYEFFAVDWFQNENHPKAAHGHMLRHVEQQLQQYEQAQKDKMMLAMVSNGEQKHSHDHNQEVRFMLRESNLGAPAFVGRNILDMGGGSDVFGKQGRGSSVLDNMGNLSVAWRPMSTSTKSIAIGLALTTRNQGKLTADNLQSDLPFFKGLLSSFCYTATVGYDYHFYIGHDHDDPFFVTEMSHQVFEMSFSSVVSKACPKVFNVSLHLVECNYTGRPAWAQNDAMMAAYMDNMEYYYRVNDDTIMESSGWTEKFIEELDRFNPARIGVVGPWFKEGNYHILTHDFVHRTHIDIFGYYYPRVFTDWFADNWITNVYYPERSRKAPGTRVKHTMEQGSRYVVHYDKSKKVNIEVEIGKKIVNNWLQHQTQANVGSPELASLSKMVISMSLYGEDLDLLYGAMRYSQLASVLYPEWRMRFYVQNFTKDDASVPRVLRIVVRKLELSGSEIVRLDRSITTKVQPQLWKYLVAYDDSVDRFLVRDSKTRPGEREKSVISDWLRTNASWHCVRDHPKHATKSLVESLVGGIPKKLKGVFGVTWLSMIQTFGSEEQLLSKAVWPKVASLSLCHDSVSCMSWPNASTFPMLRKENAFVGQLFDANDELVNSTDTMKWDPRFTRPECVFLKNTGFSEMAVKSVIRHRPVFWSQDFHVTPIMDISSLLSPIGVKVIDKSLSYYCHSVGTCAKNLKVINRNNGMSLTPKIIQEFHDFYKNDTEMKQVTTFVCTLPVSMCEAFLPFNKSILMIATMRYEHNKEDPKSWHEFNSMIQNIATKPNNIIAANNLYDAKYIEYFTGLKPVLLPNYCGYLSDSYTPKRREYLVTPIHSTELYDRFFNDFDNAILKHGGDLTIFPLREMYPQYLFSDIAAHPGIICIPYQVSMVSLTEQYRMNIPLFFPSLDLLTKWHVQYQVVRQRTWMGASMQKANGSRIAGLFPDTPDPNNDLDQESVRYWLQYADFYRWPHVIYFDSIDDLVQKMLTVDLKDVSRRMKEHNTQARAYIKRTWSRVLMKLTESVIL